MSTPFDGLIEVHVLGANIAEIVGQKNILAQENAHKR